MYRRPKFLEILHEIREQMSREADYDMDLFAEMIRSGKTKNHGDAQNFRSSETDTRPPRNIKLPDAQR